MPIGITQLLQLIVVTQATAVVTLGPYWLSHEHQLEPFAGLVVKHPSANSLEQEVGPISTWAGLHWYDPVFLGPWLLERLHLKRSLSQPVSRDANHSDLCKVK